LLAGPDVSRCREAIVTRYAEAAAAVTGEDFDDPQQAAERLLARLEDTDQWWLIVLDDLADPGHVKACGRQLIDAAGRSGG
jgi:hypothetical protein